MAVTHAAVKAPGNTLAAAEWNAAHAGEITDAMHGVRTLANAHSHANLSNVTSDQHHARSHSIISNSDHTSAATSGRILQANANGLPVDATNTDAQVSSAVTASHARAHNLTSSTDHPDVEVVGLADAEILAYDAVAGKWKNVAAPPPGVHGNEAHDPDFQDAATYAAHDHSAGDPTQVSHANLTNVTSDQHHAKQHAITAAADHTSAATPAQMLQADANGLPVDATNTNAQVSGAVAASHAKQHAITAAADHTSAATPGQILKADANGLPIDATNTDVQVSGAVTNSHVAASVADTTTIDMTLAGQQISGATIQQMSITADASGLKLVNDAAAPGNNKAYGTDAGGTKGWRDFPAAAAHDILSATHGDTLAGAVVQGDVMIGNATPKWSRLGVGADGTALMSQADGTVAWEVPPGAALPFGIVSLTPGAGVYPSTNPALLYKVDGTFRSWDEARYDDTTAESANWYFIIPPDYDGGNVEFTIYWKAAATSGAVVWQIGEDSVGDGDAFDDALHTAGFAADTAKGVAETVNTAVLTHDPGWVAGELVQFMVKRLPADAGDTMVGDAKLLAVKIKFSYS